jgi:pentapeptide MXKDX repeat protein
MGPARAPALDGVILFRIEDLEKRGRRSTILLAPGKFDYALGDSCAYTNNSEEQPIMKKILALMFALALSVSMSSFAFAQASSSDKPMDKMDKKEDKKEKKEMKKKEKKEKKEKKDEMKKDDMKKDNMSK